MLDDNDDFNLKQTNKLNFRWLKFYTFLKTSTFYTFENKSTYAE